MRVRMIRTLRSYTSTVNSTARGRMVNPYAPDAKPTKGLREQRPKVIRLTEAQLVKAEIARHEAVKSGAKVLAVPHCHGRIGKACKKI